MVKVPDFKNESMKKFDKKYTLSCVIIKLKFIYKNINKSGTPPCLPYSMGFFAHQTVPDCPTSVVLNLFPPYSLTNIPIIWPHSEAFLYWGILSLQNVVPCSLTLQRDLACQVLSLELQISLVFPGADD
jgi:hypothetical protein